MLRPLALPLVTDLRGPEPAGAGNRAPTDLLAPRPRDIWSRRALFCVFAAGFTLPYLNVLNHVDLQGGERLNALPKRGVIFLANHQTYFTEAIAFFDAVYRRRRLRWEDPFLRFSAAEETMRKNLATSLLTTAGAVTFHRSFRHGGVDLRRSVDLEGIGRIEQAIHSGWLLHFPTGTTREGAQIRPGVSRLLHSTQAVAVPVRVEGFREMLLHKQIPGRIHRRASIRIDEPMDLSAFYAAPFTPEAGALVVDRISERIGDPVAV
jgi:1-acyl-sn-glycerol-3-phosphate acyltransferase